MPSDPAVNLSSLLRQSTIDDHEEILRAANSALKANKNDVSTQHTRIVALLKLDRFEDALRAISEGGSTLEQVCRLEKSYALYKTGDLEEAAKITGSETGREFNHIAAQVAYRAEQFDLARKTYDALSKSADAYDEESDLSINWLATVAQKEWQCADSHAADSPTVTELGSSDSFEVAYNHACGSIARGELTKALALLQRAGRLCDGADELSDQEKQLEMVPILVQQAYVYLRLGRREEALKLHKQLESYELDDVDIRVVARNNFSSLHDNSQNSFATQREIDNANANVKGTKLFQFQETRLRRNKLALALNAQKIPGVVRETRRLLDAPTNLHLADVHALSVLNTTARSLIRSNSTSLKDVLVILDERPADVGAVLMAVQLYSAANNLDAASSLLETLFAKLEIEELLDVRFSPGLVALLVSLYRSQGRLGCVRVELRKASAFWNAEEGRQSSALLRAAGVELLRSSDATDISTAGNDFEKLSAGSTDDALAAAGMVACFAKQNMTKIKPFLDFLPTVKSLITGADPVLLLDQGVVSVLSDAALTKKRTADARGEGPDGNKSKKRRRKLPKSYEEGKKVDPERWLPLRDRSSYRPKGKKGKKKVLDNTQGGFVREEETLALAGGAGSVKVEKAPTQSSANNKKKKKGKK